MNTSKTHLTIQYNKTNYIFTGIIDHCHFCKAFKPVITTGKTLYYDQWVCVCEEHFDKIACKKQVCNYCQPKSIIKEIPKICKQCMIMISTNNIKLQDCQYPTISRLECTCQFCLL